MTEINTPPTPVDSSDNNSDLDDVFYASDHDGINSDRNHVHGLISSTAHLARQHENDGYRDGVSASKQAHIQSGFDEGYILGAVLGLHVGTLLGCVDGLPNMDERLKKTAREELAIQKVFGKEYFGEDGIWKWEVEDDDDDDDDGNDDTKELQEDETQHHPEQKLKNGGHKEDEKTFEHIVAKHPLVVKWKDIIMREAKRRNLDIEQLWKTLSTGED